nr:unnamed protein product [Callosobruchus analis]
MNYRATSQRGAPTKGYAPHHIVRLKRNGGVTMPLVEVTLPKTEKSQQVFNEHEFLGLFN